MGHSALESASNRLTSISLQQQQQQQPLLERQPQQGADNEWERLSSFEDSFPSAPSPQSISTSKEMELIDRHYAQWLQRCYDETGQEPVPQRQHAPVKFVRVLHLSLVPMSLLMALPSKIVNGMVKAARQAKDFVVEHTTPDNVARAVMVVGAGYLVIKEYRRTKLERSILASLRGANTRYEQLRSQLEGVESRIRMKRCRNIYA